MSKIVSVAGRMRAVILSCGLASLLAGCAVADGFSASTLRYNIEAEKTQEQGLLLNIVRASERRPLEFTGLESVTGQALTSAGASLSLPFGSNGQLAPSIFSPSATASGGPTYSVGVLETQEFYQGILTPIKPQTIDYYMHADFPHAALLGLVIEKIVVRQDGRMMTFGNFAEDPKRYAEFEGVLEDLLDQEISTEPYLLRADVGPRLMPRDLEDPRRFAALAAPDLRLVKLAVADRGNNLDDAERTRYRKEGLSEVYQVQRVGPEYRFCFGISERVQRLSGIPEQLRCAVTRVQGGAPAAGPTPGAGGTTAACAERAANPLPPQPGKGGPQAEAAAGNSAEMERMMVGPHLGRLLSEKWTEEHDGQGRQFLPAFRPDCPVSYEFVTRSTSGIISYLGSVAALQLKADGAPPRFITVPIGPPDQPVASYKYRAGKLFVVKQGPESGQPLVGVDYLGHSYWVPADIEEGGASGLVLGLVNELLILNKSAKSLPSTNVLTITGAHP